MSTFRSLIAAFFIFIAAAGPAAAQERTATKSGFVLEADSGARILLFRPAVRVGEQSTGGMFEPNADWTDSAKANIEASLRRIQSRLGNTIIVAPDVYGEDARNVEEHMALFAAVASAVIEYQFFVGNRLPTKRRDNRQDEFEWTLGETVANLPGAEDADFGLFIFNYDEYGSTGRKALQILAAIGGVGVQSGEHIGYAALVDLKTGEIVWLNADTRMGGDVREPDGADRRVYQLLDRFPGSDIES